MYKKRIFTILFTISLIAAWAATAPAQDAITGTWVVDSKNITFDISFQALQTYHSDGTMTDVTSAFPTLSESPAHGVWARQGNEYAGTFFVFVFDSTKRNVGKVRVRSAIRLIGQDSVNATWKADFILPNGNVIPNVVNGIWSGKRLRVQTVTAVNEAKHEVPASFELMQNYPNPFNPSTTIRFGLPQAAYVNIKIFDALGREVRTLVNRHFFTGTYFENWDGRDNNQAPAPSGTYFLQMKAGELTSEKKMMLIK